MISLLLTLGFLSLAVAQLTKVTCDASYQWSFNSLNQSPCVIASYLQASCEGGTYTVYDLPEGYHYAGPKDPGKATYCWCSSLTYSLLGACSLCQGRPDLVTWGTWTTNCSDPLISNGYWHDDLPAGTAVPAWAIQTFRANETFSGIVAMDIASTNKTELKLQSNDPDPPSSSPSVSTSPTSSPSPSGQSGSGTNVAAIAGGVGGGVGGALVLGVILFFIFRKRASQKRLSAPSNMMQHEYPQLATTPISQNTGRKLYDPSDPSTFPTTPPPISPLNYHPVSPAGTPSSVYHQFQPVRPANY